MIGAPPFDVGAVHESETLLFAGTARSDSGDDGLVAGVAATALDQGPTPSRFLAATRKWYRCPLVSHLTVARRVDETPSATTVHVRPALDDRCTR